MKTIEDTKIETAYNYAFNYYKQHGRSLDHQNACINQMIGLTGFDRGTCIDIQNPVQSIMMYNETVELSHTIIQQQLNIVTGIIRGRLLDINHGNVQSLKIIQDLSSYPHAHLFPSYEQFCSYAFDNPEKIGGRLIISLPPEPAKAIAALGKVIADRSLAPNVSFNQVGWGGNVFANVDKLLLCHNRLSDLELNPLIEPLHWQHFTLQTLDLSHNYLSCSSMQNLMYAITNVPLPSNAFHSVVYLNIANNSIGDAGAEIIANALAYGQMPATRSIDVSGNLLTKVGEEKLSFAVNNTPNESLAIVVEKHSNPSGVSNFFKKAFKYYTEAFAVKTKGNTEVAVGIYGHDDWNACKKLAVDFSREVTVGFVKHSEYKLVNLMLNKAPKKVKEATVGAVFVVASVEAALNVDVENLAYCLTAVNKKIFGDSVYDPKESFSSVVFMGNDGEHVDDF
jgi:hypothetical protein